jgi:hypothetical protein
MQTLHYYLNTGHWDPSWRTMIVSNNAPLTSQQMNVLGRICRKLEIEELRFADEVKFPDLLIEGVITTRMAALYEGPDTVCPTHLRRVVLGKRGDLSYFLTIFLFGTNVTHLILPNRDHIEDLMYLLKFGARRIRSVQIVGEQTPYQCEHLTRNQRAFEKWQKAIIAILVLVKRKDYTQYRHPLAMIARHVVSNRDKTDWET